MTAKLILSSLYSVIYKEKILKFIHSFISIYALMHSFIHIIHLSDLSYFDCAVCAARCCLSDCTHAMHSLIQFIDPFRFPVAVRSNTRISLIDRSIDPRLPRLASPRLLVLPSIATLTGNSNPNSS